MERPQAAAASSRGLHWSWNRGLFFKVLLVVICDLAASLPERLRHEDHDHGGLWAIITIGVVIILGQAGQLSFGHSAFYGIGAYMAALLVMKVSLPGFPARSSERWSRA